MKINLLLVGLSLILALPSLFGQNNIDGKRNCATTNYEDYLRASDPDYDLKKESVFEAAKKFAAENQNKNNSVVYTIPVVFHVVYNTAAQNITDAQIQTQVDVLNKDFRRLNTDASNVPADFAGITADPEIEFCLATVDPSGAATTGITRRQTSITEFDTPSSTSSPDPIKSFAAGGQDAWNSANYLNIWVCNLGGGTLGYATFPGTAPADKDGVVLGFPFVGDLGSAQFPYNKGRTATHEVGHYLGLRHIWGDGPCSNDDGIADTPTAEDSYGGCPTHPSTTCGTDDMFMNYMDYVDDRCMNSFTAGQVAVMRSAVVNNRAGLLSSAACSGTPPSQCINLLPNPYTMGFETTEDDSKWVIDNANGDNRSWQKLSLSNDDDYGPRTGDRMMGYFYSTTEAADDWLFTPCMNFEEGHTYELRFWYACSSDPTVYPEKLEIGIAAGQNEGSVVQILYDLGEITNAYPNYMEYVASFTSPVDLERSIGFHCYSAADNYVLNLDDINLVDITMVANENIENQSILDVFPNPATDQVTLSIESDKLIEEAQIRIMDMTGRVLIEKNVTQIKTDQLSFDVSDFANGVYFVNFASEGSTITKKVVISK